MQELVHAHPSARVTHSTKGPQHESLLTPTVHLPFASRSGGERWGGSKSSKEYLKVVQAYADALLEHGTDTYGKSKSGMILSMMDRKKMKPFSSMPKAPNGVRHSDRVTPHGSNVNLDTNFYRILYALSEIKKNKKYAKAADDALSEFLKVTPSPATGLISNRLLISLSNETLNDI